MLNSQVLPKRLPPCCAVLASADAHQRQYGIQVVVVLLCMLCLLRGQVRLTRLGARRVSHVCRHPLERGSTRPLIVRRSRLRHGLLLLLPGMGLGSREESVRGHGSGRAMTSCRRWLLMEHTMPAGAAILLLLILLLSGRRGLAVGLLKLAVRVLRLLRLGMCRLVLVLGVRRRLGRKLLRLPQLAHGSSQAGLKAVGILRGTDGGRWRRWVASRRHWAGRRRTRWRLQCAPGVAPGCQKWPTRAACAERRA